LSIEGRVYTQGKNEKGDFALYMCIRGEMREHGGKGGEKENVFGNGAIVGGNPPENNREGG